MGTSPPWAAPWCRPRRGEVCRFERRRPGRNRQARIIADAGYRGHNAPAEHRFGVYTAGQKRRVTPQVKREFKRRAAIEPVIGHLKDDHRMGRNYLASSGDAINAVLAAVGYNFRRLIQWLRLLLLQIIFACGVTATLKSA